MKRLSTARSIAVCIIGLTAGVVHASENEAPECFASDWNVVLANPLHAEAEHRSVERQRVRQVNAVETDSIAANSATDEVDAAWWNAEADVSADEPNNNDPTEFGDSTPDHSPAVDDIDRLRPTNAVQKPAISSEDSNDTTGLLWWSTIDRSPPLLVPPAQYSLQTVAAERDDPAADERAFKALEDCSKGTPSILQVERDGFFKPLNQLTAAGTVRPLAEGEAPGALTVPKNCGEAYFKSFDPRYKNEMWLDRTPEGMDFVFCNRPLYFEDANLERCGYTVGQGCCCRDCDSCCCCGSSCLQTLVSGAYFFGTIPLLPYKMALNCPCECVPSLGRCPEGCRYSCCENYLPPWDCHAALVEAAAVTGVIFIIP